MSITFVMTCNDVSVGPVCDLYIVEWPNVMSYMVESMVEGLATSSGMAWTPSVLDEGHWTETCDGGVGRVKNVVWWTPNVSGADPWVVSILEMTSVGRMDDLFAKPPLTCCDEHL